MHKTLILLLLVLSFTSCKSTKNKKSVSKRQPTTLTTDKPNTKLNPVIKSVVENAEAFEGTRYKYGGTSKSGMDCSGLIYTAFKKEEIAIPRISRDMAKTGHWIDVKEVKAGDLLFFATKKNDRKVNHVGLVTHSSTGNVQFIHATTSKGVIVSSLAERYWYFAFVQARRLL